jgi:hypothetical protein
MHDGGAGGGGHIPSGGHMPGDGHVPGHHPGQGGHGPAHHSGHDPLTTGYDQSASMAGIASSRGLSRRQTKAAAFSVIAVIVIIFIVLLAI